MLGVVDYAHTPDALANVLATAREIVPEGSQLWAVFGCGGDRDKTKRPEMARVASGGADRVIVTSDNPRTESPEAILNDIRPGLSSGATEIIDRAEAIAHAAQEAKAGDVIVVAGKGHEDYQIIGAEKRDFDDRVHLRAALAYREGEAHGPSSLGTRSASDSTPGRTDTMHGVPTDSSTAPTPTHSPEASGAQNPKPGAARQAEPTRTSDPGTHPARG